MPVTSHQVSGMISGQNAMFGNAATYAQQISPFGGGGPMPTYQNPMAGVGMAPTMMPQMGAGFNFGAGAAPSMINAGVSYGIPIMSGLGMAVGGRAGGMFDPMTAAIGSLGRSFGYQRGLGMATNLGRIGSGIARAGVGGIARAGMMAGIAAAPAMIAMEGLRYAGGQMIEGAQFQNQVSGFLQNSMRFTNPASRTGMGFDTGQQRQIGRMLQNMGMEDVMTTPQELLSLMQRGSRAGVFRGVQDAREFRRRFKEMKSTLTEIASTFNTTLSEAMPFFQNARQMGFWTPQDISRHAQQVRNIQANTGMSAQQTQQTMAMGAQMVRGIGGTGQQGAMMMARAQGITGAALFGGTVSSQQMAEAGLGTGARGAQNLGMLLAGASTRFARSRVGRWALAALMNREGTGLDQSRLAQLTAGTMSVGQMGSLARRNVSGRRAYDFVMNEEELRGQLAQAGPQATLGIVRSLAGARLFSGSNRDRLITNRLIRRFMGGSKRQAEMIARMARDMPRIMEIQSARSETSLDMQDRNREQLMNNRFEVFKRDIGHWWEENVSGPLQKAGADFGFRIGRAWEKFTDRLMGTRGRTVSLRDFAVRAMRTSALTGDMSYLRRATGGQQLLREVLSQAPRGRTFGQSAGQIVGGAIGGVAGLVGGLGGAAVGATAGMYAGQAVGGWLDRPEDLSLFSSGRRGALLRGAAGYVGGEEARAMGFGGEQELIAARGGAGARQIQEFLRSSEAVRMRGRVGGANLDRDERRRYASRVLQAVRAGRAGEEARRLMSAELGDEAALSRLSALQGRAREGATGINILGERGGYDPEAIRGALSRGRESSTEKLVTMMRGGVEDVWYRGWFGGGEGAVEGEEVTEAGMDELRTDPRGEQALLLFSRANRSTNPKERAQLRNEARQILRDMSLDKDVPDKIRTIAGRLQDPNDPLADSMAKAAGRLGTHIQAAQGFELTETIRRRRGRLRERLGAQGMNRLREAAGTVGGRLREALGGALGSFRTPEEHIQQMSALARAAISDPGKLGRMQQILSEEGLGTSEIAQVLATSRRFAEYGRDRRKTVTEEEEEGLQAGRRRGMAGARGGVTQLASELGIGGLSSTEVTGLIRGNEKVLGDLRKRLESAGAEPARINQMFQVFRGGVTQEEFQREGAKIAVASGTGSYSAKIAKEAGLKEGTESFLRANVRDTGETKELKIQTVLLRNIDQNMANLSKGETVVKTDKKES